MDDRLLLLSLDKSSVIEKLLIFCGRGLGEGDELLGGEWGRDEAVVVVVGIATGTSIV